MNSSHKILSLRSKTLTLMAWHIMVVIIFSTYGSFGAVKASNDLTVSGVIVKNGYQEFDNVTIEAGGVLTHDKGYNNSGSEPGQIYPKNDPRFNNVGLYLKVKGTLIIKSGGAIDVSGKGLSGADFIPYTPDSNWVKPRVGKGWLNGSQNGNGQVCGQNGCGGGPAAPVAPSYAPMGTGGGRGGMDPDGGGAGGGGGYIGGGGGANSRRGGSGGAGYGTTNNIENGGSNDLSQVAQGKSDISNLLPYRGSNEYDFSSVQTLIKNSGFGGSGSYADLHIRPNLYSGGGAGGGRVVIEANTIILENNSKIVANGATPAGPIVSYVNAANLERCTKEQSPFGGTSSLLCFSTGGAGAGGTVGIIAGELKLNGSSQVAANGGDSLLGNYSYSYSGPVDKGDGGAGGGGLVLISAGKRSYTQDQLNIFAKGGAPVVRKNLSYLRNAGTDGLIGFATSPISAQLTATPNQGNSPFGSTLSASISGGTGTTNFTFYCDRLNQSTIIDPGYIDKLDGSSFTEYTAKKPCRYENLGPVPITKKAQVIIERGGQSVQAQMDIVINPGSIGSLAYTYDPSSGIAPQTPTLKASLNSFVPDTASPASIIVTSPATTGFQMQSGFVSYDGSQSKGDNPPPQVEVIFPQSFNEAPDSVIASTMDSSSSTYLPAVTNVSKTGFTLTLQSIRSAGSMRWLAVKGSIPGILQAGLLPQGQSKINYPVAFSGDGSDVSVVLTPKESMHMIQYAFPLDRTNTGFESRGLSGDNYYVAVRGSVINNNKPIIQAMFAKSYSSPNLNDQFRLLKKKSIGDPGFVASYHTGTNMLSLCFSQGPYSSVVQAILNVICNTNVRKDLGIYIDSSFYSTQQEPLSVAFSTDRQSGIGSVNAKLTASVKGGEAGKATNITFYCDRSDDGINIIDPKSGFKNGLLDLSPTLTQDCTYNTTGVRKAKIIIEHGSQTIQAQLSIEVKDLSQYIYSFVCDSQTINADTAGAFVKKVSALTAESKDCTYNIGGKSYNPKVVISGPYLLQPIVATIALPVLNGSTAVPISTPLKTPGAPSPVVNRGNGDDFNYGDGSGSW